MSQKRVVLFQKSLQLSFAQFYNRFNLSPKINLMKSVRAKALARPEPDTPVISTDFTPMLTTKCHGDVLLYRALYCCTVFTLAFFHKEMNALKLIRLHISDLKLY
jgi:hypothetical protein